MRPQAIKLSLFAVLFIFISACKHSSDDNNNNNGNPPDIDANTDVKGFGLFNHINGIWSGPITSSTSVGNFPEYTADYRPISASQVSAKNEMDKKNDLFMSFFITWHCDQYKLAFRNGGYFSGMQRISYLVIDSVSENGTTAFYRFKDFKAGTNRSYADLFFTGDSLYMKVYTNKYNTLQQAVIHFAWNAGRQDASAAQPAIANFSFPQKKLVKDLCSAFDGKTESIFYNAGDDVYKETEQPYLGKTQVNFTVPANSDTSKKVFLIITTQPLFSGFTPQLQNLKYKSRYVIVKPNEQNFAFNYMHPGTYYLYGLYDADGNNTFSTGDYISSNTNYQFILANQEQKTLSLNLNFQIP